MRFCQIVIGPAGAGKSTFCYRFQEHAEIIGRSVAVINFDPAAEDLPYTAHMDIREVIDTDEVMDYCGLGPNGSLVYALEYALKDPEQESWLDEVFGGGYDEDYLLIDFPGQIEIFTHYNCVRMLSQYLKRKGYQVLTLYLLEAQRFETKSAYVSSSLVALSAMNACGTAFLPLMTKMDLVDSEERAYIDSLDSKDGNSISEAFAYIREQRSGNSARQQAWEELRGAASLFETTEKDPVNPRRRRLDSAVMELLETQGSLLFIPYTSLDEDSIANVFHISDMILNYGEDREAKESDFGIDVDEGDDRDERDEGGE